jgi:type II secretory pathway pseudopilin PulG
MIVVTIIGLLMAIAIPHFVKTRANAQRDICIEQLTKIEQAKQIWGGGDRQERWRHRGESRH